jgi:hypothetical protein
MSLAQQMQLLVYEIHKKDSQRLATTTLPKP